MHLALLLFFLSGFCGLVYEVVWLRQLSLSFGGTLPAVSTVLAAFMAGLGLGALVAGRVGDRLKRPLRVYCIMEVGVGLLGLGLTALFFHLEGVARLLEWASGGAPGLLVGLRVAVSFILVVLPTMLMGATLPVLSAALVRLEPKLVTVVSRLYGLNTAGAVVGCLGADLVLIPHLGVAQAAVVAAMVNFLVALIGYRAWKDEAPPAEAGAGEEDAAARAGEDGAPGAYPPALRWWWGALALITGACSLALEVLLTRILLSLTGSRIYAFSAMLAVFLAGLAAGSLLLAPRVLPARGRPASLLGPALLTALSGVGVFVALAVCLRIKQIMAVVSAVLPDPSYGYYTPLQALIASALVMLLPTVGLGAIFPVVIHLFKAHGAAPGAGPAVGRVYALNTVGCILGSLAGTFVLLPTLGTQQGLMLVGSALVVVGVATLWLPGGRPLSIGLRGGLTAGLLALVVLAWQVPPRTLAYEIYLQDVHARGARLLHFHEGINETVMVTEKVELGRPVYRRLITNRESMSTTEMLSQRYMKLMAHLPLLLSPSPKKALLICYGVGNTLHGLTRHEELERIWVVDISSEILGLSDQFSRTNHGAIHDPRVRTRVADGRHFLVTTDERFDVITAEPPPPAARGVVNLYSLEYYELVRRRLAPGGAFAQWLPVKQLPPWEALTLIRAFVDAFPHAALVSGESSELILLGSDRPLKLSLPRLLARTRRPAVARDLRSVGIQDAFDLLATLTMDDAALRRRTRDAEPCSDNHPTIEYADLSELNLEFSVALSRRQGDPATLISRWGDTPAEGRQNRARLARAVKVMRKVKEMGIGLATRGGRQVFVRSTTLVPPPLTYLPDTPYTRAMLDIARPTLRAARAVLQKRPRHARANMVLARDAYVRGQFARAKLHLDRLQRVRAPGAQVDLYSGLVARYLSGELKLAR